MLRAARRLWRGRAFPYDRRFVAGSLATMWAAGGVMSLLVVALPHDEAMHPDVVAGLGSMALALAAVIWLTRTVVPSWAYPLTVCGGTATITALVIAGGGGVTSLGFGFLYAWIIVYAIVFFTPRVVVGLTLLCITGIAVSHVALGEFQAVAAISLVGTVGITALVVGGLARQRDTTGIDALTAVPSRMGIERALEAEMARAQHGDLPLTVAILGFDNFKGVNERVGSTESDRLLQLTATLWRAEIRAVDTLGRLGGDEFVVVLPACPPSEGHTIVERLRACMPDGLACSAGLTSWQPGDSVSLLLSRADSALYEAKRTGRGRTITNGGDGAAMRELERAIADGELVLYYQPTVDMRTGGMTGVEALVRWQHPVRGLVPPLDFIPLAEDTGLIIPMGAWVLQEACRAGRTWLDRFPEHPLKVAVNVSGRQLDHPDFVATVSAALAHSGFPADHLTLEITESIFARDVSDWILRLEEIRALGVTLALDDFGTGYSSLNQLRRLPVGTVKIDRSFITDLAESDEAAALVKAMVGMGHGLGRSLLAEGVETIAQLDALYLHGFDEVQGYLLGRPMAGELIPRLLEDLRPLAGDGPAVHRGRVEQLIAASAALTG